MNRGEPVRRRPVAAFVQSSKNGEGEERQYIHVVCDDGFVCFYEPVDQAWEVLPPIPGTRAAAVSKRSAKAKR